MVLLVVFDIWRRDSSSTMSSIPFAQLLCRPASWYANQLQLHQMSWGDHGVILQSPNSFWCVTSSLADAPTCFKLFATDHNPSLNSPCSHNHALKICIKFSGTRRSPQLIWCNCNCSGISGGWAAKEFAKRDWRHCARATRARRSNISKTTQHHHESVGV